MMGRLVGTLVTFVNGNFANATRVSSGERARHARVDSHKEGYLAIDAVAGGEDVTRSDDGTAAEVLAEET